MVHALKDIPTNILYFVFTRCPPLLLGKKREDIISTMGRGLLSGKHTDKLFFAFEYMTDVVFAGKGSLRI